MKKAFFLTLMIGALLMGTQLMAQSRMTEEEKQEAIEKYQAFMEELNLSEEQKPMVEEINMNFITGLAELKETDASKLEKYRTFKDLSSTRDKKMKEVLDKEQYEKFKAFQEETKSQFKERRKNKSR